MSAVEELRQTERTRIRIDLRYERSDAALAQALEQNPFVTDIELRLDGVQQTDWNSFLRVIATRANLEKVTLRDGTVGEVQECTRRVGSLILASNAAEHFHTKGGVGMATSSHRYFYICWTMHLQSHHSVCSTVTWNLPSGNKEQESLAAALQRNKNIESLELSDLEDIYAIPIVRGLEIKCLSEDFYLLF